MYNKLNKNSTLIIIFFFFIIYSTNILAAVRVEPARIILKENGSRQTGVIEVLNTGEMDIQLTAFLSDWELDENDSPVYLDSGETKYTLDHLIKFNPKKFTISPKKKQIVRFTIDNPEDVEEIRERRGIVFFEHETDYTEDVTGSKIITQTGTVIYYIPEGVKYNFQFMGLRLYNTKVPDPQGISLRINNGGEGHIRYYPSYIVIDSKNKVVMENKFDELIILPGHERQFSFYLEERLEPGEYKFLLTFDLYNTNRNAEYQIPITIE